MAGGGVYGGWTHAGRQRVWVRVPAALKQRADRLNGDGLHPAIDYGHIREATVAAQAQSLTETYWGRTPLENGDGALSGPPVVLVHGIATSSRGMEPLLRALGSHRPVFAPDLPGFGRSDPPPRALDLTGLAASLRRWMLDNHLAPAVLVGASFGCQVVIELASRHPELAERLVLVGPTDPHERERRLYSLRWAASTPRLAPVAVRDLLDTRPWNAKRALEQAKHDPVTEKLGRIEAPTLVVRGRRDLVTPESWASRLADGIPVARVETIDRAGHMPANGAVGRLAEAIESFLEEELERAQPPGDVDDLGLDEPLDADEDPAPGTRHARLIVDGMNVIGSRPDGWWRDRERAWRRLHRQLEALASDSGDEIRLVIDGSRPPRWREGGPVECCFARGGRGAADDAIVARVAADPHPETLTVVTSDRELGERVRELGAEVAPSKRFLDRLDSV